MKIGLSFPEIKIKHQGVQNAQHQINRFVHLFSHQHLTFSFPFSSESRLLTGCRLGRRGGLWLDCRVALAHQYQSAQRVLSKDSFDETLVRCSDVLSLHIGWQRTQPWNQLFATMSGI
jgi:hypothetical protein